MKPLFTFLFVLFFYTPGVSAQNYQCLQNGVKHYFINGNNYLRGIRIDSVKTFSDSTIYYPFHTPRGGWGPGGLAGDTTNLDSTKGSWLGKKTLQLNDGTFLFDNLWGDTVVIQTQATLGSSWLFCRDTSSLYYMATVTSIDTMSFLGVYDTIKTITINAYYHSALLTTDSLNGFQIMLSKNNGFVQVFDLYTFPYHPAGTIYTTGLDFYLDQCLMIGPSYPASPPGANNSIFKLVAFINPTSNQLYAANIGDVFERTHSYCAGCPSGPGIPDSYTIDTITTKSVLPHSITYTSSGLTGNYNPMTYSYPATYYAGGYTTNDSTYLFDPTKMPEETNTNVYSYYFPDDSSHCTVSPSYESGLTYYINGYTYIYKIGFGQVYYYYQNSDPIFSEDELIFANKNNDPCGSSYLLTLGISVLDPLDNSLTVYPNPATTSLTITSTENITNIIITNIVGQKYIQKPTTRNKRG